MCYFGSADETFFAIILYNECKLSCIHVDVINVIRRWNNYKTVGVVINSRPDINYTT